MKDYPIQVLRGNHTVSLHLNPDFHAILKNQAEENGRSFNAEVIAQLSKSTRINLPIPDYISITGADIKKYRIAKKLTQVELAIKLGITHSETISRWETGNRISRVYQQTFNRICLCSDN